MSKSLPKGFIPVMLTPFHSDGSIDVDALSVLTEQYISWGAAGLFANCLSSEMFELTQNERLQLVETVLKTVDGRIPVVATGTFGKTIEEMADFSNQVWQLGVDAVIVLNNLLVDEEEGDEVFLERLKDWMQLTPGVNFGFYECPVPYKRLISSKVLQTLLPSGRFIYHKDTSLALEQIKEKVQISKNGNLGIYDAYMVHAVASLHAGVNGLSCIQGNFFPELIVWLCKNFDNPDVKKNVEAIQSFFIETMDVIHHTYPISAKYVLSKRGFDFNLTTRREVGELTVEQKSKLDDLITKGEYLIDQL
ncbi:MAG: 4-hydroxy-tetrahydrodipicolinate synthase [Bacteroidota bacterium]